MTHSNYTMERWPDLVELRKQVAIELIRSYGSKAVTDPYILIASLGNIMDAIMQPPTLSRSSQPASD